MKNVSILVLDFGSQYTQLIARRIREQNVFSQIVHHSVSLSEVNQIRPAAIILSGGPSSVYGDVAPEFDDHHPFSVKDMDSIRALYEKIGDTKKIYITTEKDAIRLDAHRQYIIDHKMPIFILPAGVEFLFGQKDEFDGVIKDFLMGFMV